MGELEVTINRKAKLFITGHAGMLGSKTLKLFKDQGYSNIITANHAQLDLTDQSKVDDFFKRYQPEYVIHIAAKVGGIKANIDNPAIFLYDNLMMQANVIHAAYQHGVKKFVFIASSCIYPAKSKQPMKERYLLDGKLEPTNEGYAIAKLTGIKLLESYHKQYGFQGISLIPSNLYGPNDTFDLDHAHVLSALVKRFVDAKNSNEPSIKLWGTGIAQREFLHVDDFSRAILYFFENYNNPQCINIGTGTDISIKNLASLIANQVNYKGQILWDVSKPDGMLKKCMDVTYMKEEGFYPKKSLEDGIDEVIKSYKDRL